MLKSLFFKKKSETDGLLPPPPPFPSMELEEMPEQDILSEDEFKDLFSEAKKEWDLEEIETKPAKKLSKKELKRLGKIKAKERLKKKMAKWKPEPKEEPFNLDKDWGIMPEPEFQDLEEFGIGDLKAEEEIKPKEIKEAEEEIANAIEGAKKPKRLSFFSGLFKKEHMPEQGLMPEIEADNLEAVRKRINEARNALMNLDLEAAKNDYMEIMRIYNKMKPEEQTQIYLEIKDLYYERKNAEELKM